MTAPVLHSPAPSATDDELEALRREAERLRVLADDDAPEILETLLRHSPHGILVCDAVGRLTLHNEAAERIWGGSATTATMTDWSQYRAFHADGRPYSAEDWAMARCLREGAVIAAEEVSIVRFDGTRALILGSCAPLFGRDRQIRGAISVFADITAFHDLGAAERALRERTAKLQEITALLSEARLPADVAQVVAMQMAAIVGAKQGVLVTPRADGDELELLASAGLSPGNAERFARFPVDSPMPVAHTFLTGEDIWIASPAELRARFPATPAASSVAIGAVACVPLQIGSSRLGAIGFGFTAARVFDAADRALIRDLATQATLALERARLYEAERVARRRTETMAKVARRFAEAGLDSATIFDEITTELGQAFDATTGITLVRPNGQIDIVSSWHPLPEARAWQRRLAEEAPVPAASRLGGAVARTGKTILIPRIDPAQILEQTAPEYRAYTERYPVHAYLCVALRARGRVLGTLSLGRNRPDATFTDDDRIQVEDLADRAAIAIENARLYEEDAHARARAEQLYRFAERAVKADKLEEVFEAALDAIVQGLDTDRASILVCDRDGVMRFRAFRGLSNAYRTAVEGHSPWARDARSPEPVLVPDVTKDPTLTPYLPLFQSERIGALAFIPLVTTGGRLLGKFMVYDAEPRVRAPHEIDLAKAIANHLASVIDRFAALDDVKETLHYSELFSGVLAHDLRNPLGAMMSAAQLLLRRQEGAADAIRRPLDRILSSGERMTRMIEQLLDLTRIRVGGAIELLPRPTDLGDLCAQVVAELELAWPTWHIELRAQGSLSGTWDPDRVQQIFSNLVSNAGQHGEQGASIRVALDGTSPDVLVASVHNKGTIPPESLANLFDPFGAARRRREGSRGLGLGLYIARELALAHGGRIEVASTAEHGTTFTVRLPRVTPTSAKRP